MLNHRDYRRAERGGKAGKYIYLIHEHNGNFMVKLQTRTVARRLEPYLISYNHLQNKPA